LTPCSCSSTKLAELSNPEILTLQPKTQESAPNNLPEVTGRSIHEKFETMIKKETSQTQILISCVLNVL
jgi:hypothetical protein